MATETVDRVRLFNDIENLDDHITLTKLSMVQPRPAVVVVKVNLPLGEVFRMPGEEYGIYLLNQDADGNDIIRGFRVGRRYGGEVSKIAVEIAKMVLEGMGVKDPQVVYFETHVNYTE